MPSQPHDLQEIRQSKQDGCVHDRRRTIALLLASKVTSSSEEDGGLVLKDNVSILVAGLYDGGNSSGFALVQNLE